MGYGWKRLRGLLAHGVGIALCMAAAARAHADIGVAIADPTTIGVSWFTHAGHSVVYLSGVCAAGPLQARLCREGEAGSVVTMYPDFYEQRPYAWNLVPLNLYLEGLATPGDRLLYGSAGVKAALELHARIAYLAPVCGLHACAQREHAYWRDLVAATVDRDLFVYAIHTTRAQDEQVVQWLNANENRNAYNSLTNNCSNFTERLINRLFPHAVHRDLLNDLGMMSPKGAARSFTLWAAKRPELGLYALHFAQQPGPIPRSSVARSGTEDGFHMKKYMIPAALIGDHEVAGSFLVAYYLTGRFGLYKQYAKHAAPSPVLDEEALPVEEASRTVLAPVSRTATIGGRREWAHYRAEFARLLASEEVIARPKGPAVRFPAELAQGAAWTDGSGQPFITVGHGLAARTVGVSSGDLLDPRSDPGLAFHLMLARVAYALTAKNHYRESMPMLRADWALLLAARQRLHGGPAAGGGLLDGAARQ